MKQYFITVIGIAFLTPSKVILFTLESALEKVVRFIFELTTYTIRQISLTRTCV